MPNPPFGSESWSGSSQADVRSAVLDALRSGAPAICVTGGAASGKTALCKDLAAGVDDHSFSTGLFDSSLDPDAVLLQLLSDFGLGAGGSADGPAHTRDTLSAAVVRFLKSLQPLGAHALIVVDDAEHVGVDVFATLVKIARDAGNDSLRLVLVGRPGLDARLLDAPLREFPGAHRTWTRVGLGLDDALVPVIPPASAYVAVVEPEPEVAVAAAASSRLTPLLAGLLVVLAGAGWWYTSRGAAPGADAPAAVVAEPPAARPAASPPAASAAESPSTASPGSGTASRGAAPVESTGDGPYRITVASFRTASRAQQIAASLQAQRLAVATRVAGNGTWHQVVAGPYASIEAARDAQRTLERAGFPATQISLTAAAANPQR